MSVKLSTAQVNALRAMRTAEREKKQLYRYIARPWPTTTLRSLERLGLIVWRSITCTLTDAGREVLDELDAADQELTQAEVIATFRSKTEVQP